MTAVTTPQLGEDFETVADALNNNAHGPLCEFGQCPACEALDALDRIKEAYLYA